MQPFRVQVKYTTFTRDINYQTFTFSGGEEHVRFHFQDISKDNVRHVHIATRLTSSAAIMQLHMAVNAIRNHFGLKVPIEVSSPYFPYARQDRVCSSGEAFGAKVMADIINNLDLAAFYIVDPHSPVTTNKLTRTYDMDQESVFLLNPRADLREIDMVVAPDKGACIKAKKVQELLGIPSLIHATKVRDTGTGNILNTSIHGNVTGKTILIPDDICDGGQTFLELGKLLKGMGAKHITLYVTHGIFSRGFNVFEGIIDKIITTNSFRSVEDYAAMDSNVPTEIFMLQGLPK